MGVDKLLARSALNDHASPPIWILLVTTLSHDPKRFPCWNPANSHSPDTVKLNLSGTIALSDGKVYPLPVGNTRIYNFKTCVQIMFRDDLIEFASQFYVRWWLIVDVKGVPRHVKEPPCAFCICSDNPEINK